MAHRDVLARARGRARRGSGQGGGCLARVPLLPHRQATTPQPQHDPRPHRGAWAGRAAAALCGPLRRLGACALPPCAAARRLGLPSLSHASMRRLAVTRALPCPPPPPLTCPRTPPPHTHSLLLTPASPYPPTRRAPRGGFLVVAACMDLCVSSVAAHQRPLGASSPPPSRTGSIGGPGVSRARRVGRRRAWR